MRELKMEMEKHTRFLLFNILILYLGRIFVRRIDQLRNSSGFETGRDSFPEFLAF